MSNSVQAAGEAMPGNLIAVLYKQWKAHSETANTLDPSEEADAAVEKMFTLKDAILALPTVTLQDYATKVAVCSQGDDQIDRVLVGEARELADASPKNSMKAISGCIMDAEDKLANARYLCRAIAMAAHALADHEQMNAFQMLAEQITTTLSEVRDELDEVREAL